MPSVTDYIQTVEENTRLRRDNRILREKSEESYQVLARFRNAAFSLQLPIHAAIGIVGVLIGYWIGSH